MQETLTLTWGRKVSLVTFFDINGGKPTLQHLNELVVTDRCCGKWQVFIYIILCCMYPRVRVGFLGLGTD